MIREVGVEICQLSASIETRNSLSSRNNQIQYKLCEV